MSDNGQSHHEFDSLTFHRNQQTFPVAQLACYQGKHVAWNLEGTRILASGEDMGELYQKLARAGIDASQAVMDYIDPFDLVRL